MNNQTKDEKAHQECLARREILRANMYDLDNYTSDQVAGVEYPPLQKECQGEEIQLPEVSEEIVKTQSIYECIKQRQSRRKFTDVALSLDEMSFLLWATQGVRKSYYQGKLTTRTVPSGGSRHPFETYLAVYNVESLKSGIYLYRPLTHSIVFLYAVTDLKEKIIDATFEQRFVGETAVTFIWSVIPYRTEWRYTVGSHRIILQDSGHLCQNLYLACEALGLGTCAIGAYDQKKIDNLLKIDGIDESVIYIAPVGKV